MNRLPLAVLHRILNLHHCWCSCICFHFSVVPPVMSWVPIIAIIPYFYTYYILNMRPLSWDNGAYKCIHCCLDRFLRWTLHKALYFQCFANWLVWHHFSFGHFWQPICNSFLGRWFNLKFHRGFACINCVHARCSGSWGNIENEVCHRSLLYHR